MALPNGVLVHGPTSWACAVRRPDGELKVESDYKRFRAAEVRNPLLRGPARIAEVFALLPAGEAPPAGGAAAVRAPAVLAAMAAAAALAVRLGARRRGGWPAAQELLGGLLSLAPAALALRGSELAAYHGAEHISIGTYEHGEPRAKEHERCGSHLVGPLVVTLAVGDVARGRARPRIFAAPARAAAQLGALAASTEIFAWMARNPEHPLSRALAQAGPRAPAPASPRPSRRPSSSRSPRRRSRPASSSSDAWSGPTN